MTVDALLIEIGTEELPPKLLPQLSRQFTTNLEHALKQWKLSFGAVESFSTPRRLAVLVHDVPSHQADASQVRKGPAIKAAFDNAGNPTPAALGFAKSCGVSVSELNRADIGGDAYLTHTQALVGKSLEALLQTHLEACLDNLHAPKKMRWGSGNEAFVRPIHWICALHGSVALKLNWHRIQSSANTYGHRFHHPEAISLKTATDYQHALHEAKVLVNSDERKETIRKQIAFIADEKQATPYIPEELLDEVNNLVEWPNALLGEFDQDLLKVPPEALITAMQHHQKCFALLGPNQILLPYFVLISNIAPQDPSGIVTGNERVINARLNDAKFFFEKDQKTLLADHNTRLRTVIFQKQLGSLYDKVIRIAKLSQKLLPVTGANAELVDKAAHLSKADLMTEMVGEFPELQGIMGHAYAELEGYPEEVALALKEIYLPRFAGDHLPETAIGLTLSLADRLDTLVGIFAIGGAPTGDKDPFGLRRAAIGILRLLIEKELSIDLYAFLNDARENYTNVIEADVLPQILTFVQERLKSLLHDRGYDLKLIDAVMSLNPTNPYDAYLRIQAVKRFMELPEAESLCAANKRVRNILTKADAGLIYAPDPIQAELLKDDAEKTLAEQIAALNVSIAPLIEQHSYTDALSQLASLREAIDHFFDKVMVMVDEPEIRQNRILLLNHLYHSFKQIADISRL